MTSFPKLQLGTTARALAAALAIGATVLTLSTGPTAYAARSRSMEPGDTGTGAGQPAAHRTTGSSTAARDVKDDGVRCSFTFSNGHVEFYLPGEEVVYGSRRFTCGGNGEWIPWRTVQGDGATVGGVGVATQAP
jgi:subtilisin family serine protease